MIQEQINSCGSATFRVEQTADSPNKWSGRYHQQGERRNDRELRMKGIYDAVTDEWWGKDSGWPEKNDNWESEEINNINIRIFYMYDSLMPQI
jgi:hypothetical protein